MEDNPKTKLSEVLGALVASVAHGRQVADIEALRIARHYEKNDLLKGLPVPRLRISQVNISLPMIMSEVIPGIPAKANDPKEISRKTKEALEAEIREEKSHQEDLYKLESITENRKKSICTAIGFLEKMNEKASLDHFDNEFKNKLKRSFLDLELSEGENSVSDASIRYSAAEAAEDALLDVIQERSFLYVEDEVREKIGSELKTKDIKLKEEDVEDKIKKEFNKDFDPDRARSSTRDILEEDYVKNLIKDVRRSAENAALISKTVAPDIFIAVDTDSIKNAGGGSNTVTRLNLLLREEGLEWLAETKEGKEIMKLMPE